MLEHIHGRTHTHFSSLMRETKKKQLIWLSTKPRARKYIQIMQNAKKNPHYCFQSEHVLKSCTLPSPTVKKRQAEMLYYRDSKYAKPSGKETNSSSDLRCGDVNKTAKRVIKSTIRANMFHCLRQTEIVRAGRVERGELIETGAGGERAADGSC